MIHSNNYFFPHSELLLEIYRVQIHVFFFGFFYFLTQIRAMLKSKNNEMSSMAIIIIDHSLQMTNI